MLTCILALGIELEKIIECITIAPARAIGIDEHAGSLAVGRPADVSVMKIEDGDFVRRGVIMGNGKMLRCSLHGFIFNLDSGKGVNAGPQCIDIFEIRRDGSRLQARKKQT